jgi:ribonuclease Z
LTIYGPTGIKEYVEVSLRVSATHLKYPIGIVEIEDGVIFEDHQFIVTAGKLEHGIPCFGYRIMEKDVKGALEVDKLKKLGISPGPIYQKIKAGEEILLTDGTKINGADFVGPDKTGRKLAILGDTRFNAKAIELAVDVDLLVHEATFGKEDEAIAYDYFHSTTIGAARVAKEAKSKELILTHISSRYQGNDKNSLLEEAQEVFPNVIIAHDFYKLQVNRR